LGEVFRESEVDHLNAGEVVFLVKHEVLRFDVSVGNLVFVEILKS
jgi:hypothetical protein